MKLSDGAVKNPGTLRWNGLNRRGAGVERKPEDEEEEEEEEETPAPMTVAGGATATASPNSVRQNYVGAKSFQNDIFYLLHAYDYYPNNPMICLCLAFVSVGWAMQRQFDNMHYS
ncbi:hypothetical protein BJ165DRAFT_1406952 [Panaeolus papilionaceus]|nr:hypothetical protein BJ165DRAFT_1406952 [Panaeolus papilionaceus]